MGQGDGAGGHLIFDVAVEGRLEHGSRVLIDGVGARVGWLGGRFHQLRCEAPVAAARGDRLTLRTAEGARLGEALVLDPGATRHGPSNDVLVALTALERGTAVAPPPLDAPALALERRYRHAGAGGLADRDLSPEERAGLFALREAGRVIRLASGAHVHAESADGRAPG
jgi:hypothetical protein